MIKKISFYLFLVSLLVFSGCGSKEEQVDLEDEIIDEEIGEEEDIIEDDEFAEGDEELGEEEAEVAQTDATGGPIENIYFAFDKFFVSASMKSKVSNNVSATQSASSIKIEGNCDEWGTDEYNYALGLKRANSVKNAMVAEGVNASKISIVSFGESNPTCSTKSESCWQLNRRVETRAR
ncbi:MAG: peptidoglycan-associated lipoprotein [Epsilonproteobacteria bacterium]|nr:MAG: peptidoglycan-associated lipoprotein [Campylobacterota bacterium]